MLAIGLVGFGLTGCAVDTSAGVEEGDSASLARTEAPLVADSNQLWLPSGNTHLTKLSMCWSGSAGDPAGRQAVQDVIAQTWDASSWVDVTWASTCSAGMIPVSVADTKDAPAGDPTGLTLNFTFSKWSTGCQGTGTAAQKEATRISCIKTVAAHEFGHVLAFVHEQNRTNGAGIDCTDGSHRALDTGTFTITQDWDVTGIDTASIMSYCPEGEWSGLLTATDIAGLRAVYGGEGNGIQHDSKVAVRQYDKQYWQGNGSVGPDFKGIRIRRLPATAGSVRLNDQVRFDLGGKFLCAKSGTANSIEWTATYVEAKCSWRVNQVDAQWDGTTVDVNDPLTVSLQLTAAQNGGTAFSANFGPVRFLRVL
jgi:hypothetical protein